MTAVHAGHISGHLKPIRRPRPGRRQRGRHIRVWDVAARRTTTVLSGHAGLIIGAVFNPDGSTLAASIQLWNTRTARLRAPSPTPTPH
jgi:WD40 repeat protein